MQNPGVEERIDGFSRGLLAVEVLPHRDHDLAVLQVERERASLVAQRRGRLESDRVADAHPVVQRDDVRIVHGPRRYHTWGCDCIDSGDVFSACGRLDATSGSPFRNTVDSEWFAYASKMYSIQ